MVGIFDDFKSSNRSPRDKQQFLYDFTTSFIEVISIRLLSDCRVVWSSYFIGAMTLYYFFCSFYTFYYYQSQNDVISGLKPIALVGVVTAVTKNYFFIQMQFAQLI